MAQRIASQKRMLSSVIVTFRITLTIKRSIRKPAMTDTTVTTCGVTIFEISQMTPITMESRIVSSMKRVQPKRRTCLGEVGCCLILSVLFDASALMKAGCVNVLIHDDCIHIGAFNSFKSNNKIFCLTRVVESYARKKPSVCSNSWCVGKNGYLGS